MSYLDNVKLKKLLFADSLAVFSLSMEDLQRRISILKQYSNKWGLELSLSKIKIMIFNKLGENTGKFKFTFNDKKLKQ